MLAVMTAYLEHHGQAGVAHCAYGLIGPNGETASVPVRLFRRFEPWEGSVRAMSDDQTITPWEAIYWWTSVMPLATVIRRSVYAQAAGWDELFGHGCEDTDLYMRLSLVAPFHYVPRELARYRLHPAQTSKKQAQMQRQQNRMHRKWFQGAHLNPEQRAAFRRVWREYEGVRVPRFWLKSGLDQIRRGRLVSGLACFARTAKHLALRCTLPLTSRSGA